jgi:hypothetical protein
VDAYFRPWYNGRNSIGGQVFPVGTWFLVYMQCAFLRIDSDGAAHGR